MAGTTIADLVTPACAQVMQSQLTSQMRGFCAVGDFWNSGIIDRNNAMAIEIATQAHPQVTQRFWDDANLTALNPLQMDTAQTDYCANCVGPSEYGEQVIKQARNFCLEDDKLTSFYQACDEETAYEVAISTVENIKVKDYEAAAMSALVGVYLADVAAGNNITSDVSADAGNDRNGIPLNQLSFVTIVNATALRDCYGMDGIIVHPTVFANMQTQGFQTCPCDDDGNRMGVNDPLLGPNGQRIFRANKYLAPLLDLGGSFLNIMYSNGALPYGEGCPRDAIQAQNLACDRNEKLVVKYEYVMHVKGHSNLWVPAGTELSPSNATLALATTWNRVAPIESVPLHFLITAG